jgi:hypothetical protein
MARAIRPGGRMVSVCWQEPTKIEWAAAAIGAAATHLGLPDFGSPGAPGPFALADGARLSRILEAGGFRDFTSRRLPGHIASATTSTTLLRSSLPLTSLGPSLPASPRTKSPSALTPSGQHSPCMQDRTAS